MTTIWIGQRVVINKRTGTIQDAYYQGDLLNLDDDVLMFNVLMDETHELLLMPVDAVSIVGLEDIE
jgi:uncharacterized protein YihD (DUF1040 family)